MRGSSNTGLRLYSIPYNNKSLDPPQTYFSICRGREEETLTQPTGWADPSSLPPETPRLDFLLFLLLLLIVLGTLSAVRAAGSRTCAVGAMRAFAGLWADLHQTWPCIEKTKAHCPEVQAGAERNTLHWHGNYEADKWAKVAAQAHLPSNADPEAYDLLHNLSVRWISIVTRPLFLWPPFASAAAQGHWVKATRPALKEATQQSG